MTEPSPFGGGPLDDLMRNLARLFTSSGPVNWEIARQVAVFTSTAGQQEGNPDPVARVHLEELLRVAEMHVASATGLAPSERGGLAVNAVTKSQWALATLDAWRPLLERLATASARAEGEQPRPFGFGPPAAEGDLPPDPMSQLLGNLPQVLGPVLFGVQSGAMVGDLAARAMGQYDLPMPRPASEGVLLVPVNIDAFASDWSLGADDVRMWVCLREVANHSVLRLPHVRGRLEELAGRYVDAFQPNTGVIEQRLSGFDPTDMASLQAMFGDPEALVGEMQSDEQRRLAVPLQSLLAVIAGYVDHVMDSVGRRLIGGYGPLTEALRRRRLEEGQGTRIMGKLLGVGLDEGAYSRGQAFVRGVLERAGEEGLGRLWASARELPTPAEVQAPGLWLARIDLPDE
ncbi:MAG TPA: zinc-dependent metalloprotease [Acidimicrobiales bacterium]|nr:zinc-dependent metalloprotease [Acidimicrobiales bacterium]